MNRSDTKEPGLGTAVGGADANPVLQPFSADTQLLSDPLSALFGQTDDAVIAMIVGTEGPSYRDPGAAMVILANGRRIGALSSGCIDNDIALHAGECLKSGLPAKLRYGRGSPFLDIRLPCGGGLDILLLPRPDRRILDELEVRRRRRDVVVLAIDAGTGALSLLAEGQTGWDGHRFLVRYEPPPQFVIVGKGPAATTFAALVRSGGFPHILASQDDETLSAAASIGCRTESITSPHLPVGVTVDPWTAIVLFFHDHEWEPPILVEALETPAFFIGAQGSRRTAETRKDALLAEGVDAAELARIRGPIGLIPSTRDPGTLAVSVLAEVLTKVMDNRTGE